MRIVGIILLWVMFIIGFVFSGFFQNYFLVEGEYVRDTLIIQHLASGRSGGSQNCSYYGVLLSNNEPAGLPCNALHDYFGDERMSSFNRIRDKPKELRMPVFTYVPRGGAHVYLEDKKSYYPGAMPRLPIFSIPTLLMLPLLLMFLTRYLRLGRERRNQLGLWLLVLWSLGATGLYGQAGSGGDTLYTFNIDYVSRLTIALDLVRYEDLALKKTTFDTTHFKLQYPEECLLAEISATDEATLKYCHENDDIRKNPQHYESIANMSPDDLYLQPTLKLVQYFPDDTIAWIKLYFVDNIRGRKIRAVKQMEWQTDKWQLSAEKLDADLAFALSGIRDEVLEAIFLRRYQHDHELFAMQEACFAAGVFNFRALANAYQSWFVKGHEQTALIEKYGENLIQ